MSSSLQVTWATPGALSSSPSTEEIRTLLSDAKKQLGNYSHEEIVAAFDDLSRSLLHRNNPLLSAYPGAGLPYLAALCRKEAFSGAVSDALGGLDCLDGFVPRLTGDGSEKRAYPRGIICHWIAGNVPTLGLLSLLSALMTKNANLVRLPSASDNVLPDLLAHLHSLGEVHARLAESVAVVRYDHKEEIAGELSLLADTRIIWGGDESTAHVKSLPSKPGCFDVIFPDKTSFAVVAGSNLEGERARVAARLIAHDASVFEQRACASPHTVLLSTDSDDVVDGFCELLHDAMIEIQKTIPKTAPSSVTSSAVLNLRSQYDIFHKAWYPEGLSFSILSDNKPELGPAIGDRTLFVRKLPKGQALERMIPPNIQTAGLAAEGDEYEELTQRLGQAGVHRITRLGGMTHFGLPWDGVLIPQFLVRWTTRQPE